MHCVLLAFAAYGLIEKGIPDDAYYFSFVVVFIISQVVDMIALSVKDDDEGIFNLWLKVKKKNLRKQLSDDWRLKKDNETPLPYKIDILAEDLMLVLDAMDALPETYNYGWFKRLTQDSNSALLDSHLKRSYIGRHWDEIICDQVFSATDHNCYSVIWLRNALHWRIRIRSLRFF